MRDGLGAARTLDDALTGARDVDDIAVRAMQHLRSDGGVLRVGVALTEGGGRRLRFLESDRVDRGEREWSLIDAYEDVPLTFVARTGEAVLANLDDLPDFGDRFSQLLAQRRAEGAAALAVMPLPGTGSPLGGLVVYFAGPQGFPADQVRLLEQFAASISRAVRRLRLTVGRHGADAVPVEPAIPDGALTDALLLESDPRASGAARRFLRSLGAQWGVDEDVVDTAQLCLSELVTNAVVHAGTASELRVILEDRLLTVIVRDLGGLGGAKGEEPHPSEDPDPLRVFGRGLMLVDALSDRWGSERDVTGTTVWFVVSMPDPQAAVDAADAG
ncbi:ATP-binding protein [Nocardioides ferulae]|uniref:ATP-binding protein n=1 Tax=Nocardioides ferulae TaxID=2340821 RepID=UPI000EB4EBFD|nr:ATP-binding protein [Nocardioides ferulae]